MLILCLFIPIIALSLFMNVNNYQLTPQWFSYIRYDAAERYEATGMFYGTFDWSTWMNVLYDFPKLVFQFTFSPLPILHNYNPLNLALYMVDLMFVLLIFILSIKKLFGTDGRLLWLAFFVVGVLMFSFWEFFIGGAVRHRIPFVLLLIFPAVESLNLDKYRIRWL